MKCPRCGSDVTGKEPCSRCGAKTAPLEELEVRYKVFKVSEFLEIGQKKNDGKTEADPQRTNGKHPAGPVRETRRPPASSGKKLYTAIAAVILLLALIAGLLYAYLHWR